MSKFKERERVKLVSKSCGDILSLKEMLVQYWQDKMPAPSSGTVISYSRYHDTLGSYYSVEVDEYDSQKHRFRQYSFKEYDLAKEDSWDIEELFDL